jgi:hypothetical protein
MPDKLKYILLLLICFTANFAVAQISPTRPYNPAHPYNPNNPNQQGNGLRNDTTTHQGKELSGDQMIDTLRKRERQARDTVIFTAKFIKVTNEALLKDSTQLFPIDTTLANFENYSPLFQPRSPKISLGSTIGLAARPLF